MRIAFISYEYPPDTAIGGIGTYVFNVSKLMAQRGHDVSVFTASTDEYKNYQEDGVRVIRVREINRHDFAISVAGTFQQEHDKKPFDLIEGPDFCADARKITDENPKVPYILCMHTPSKLSARLNTFVNYRHEAKKYLGDVVQLAKRASGTGDGGKNLRAISKSSYLFSQNRIERKEAQKADMVISPSIDLCTYAKEKWSVPASKVFHSPYPFIPDPRFLDISTKTEVTQKITVGYLGRIQYRKGISFLVAAIPEIVKKYPGVTFRFVGSIKDEPITGKPYDEWIRGQLHDFQDHVDVVGPVPFDKITDELARMDIVVLPSIWENFPNSCLEAMSAGRAIVGSKNGGMAEMLDRETYGLLADPKNRKELAEKISYLIENPGKRTELGKKARKRVLEAYNGSVIGKQKEELYQAAIRFKSEALP